MFWCTGPTGEIVAAADDKKEAVLVAKFDLMSKEPCIDLDVDHGIHPNYVAWL